MPPTTVPTATVPTATVPTATVPTATVPTATVTVTVPVSMSGRTRKAQANNSSENCRRASAPSQKISHAENSSQITLDLIRSLDFNHGGVMAE